MFKKKLFNWVIALLCVFLMVEDIKANDNRTVLSTTEIEQLIPQIEAVENSVINLRIDSEAWIEEREKQGEPWKRTPVEISATLWFQGDPKNKTRIDIHSENRLIRREDTENSRYARYSYNASYDGQFGKVLYKDYEANGKIDHLNKGEIIRNAPEIFSGKRSGAVTGFRMTTKYFFVDKQRNETFSQYFKIAISPEALKNNAFEVARETFHGVQCISFALTASKTLRMTWWFDPSRGFALLGHEKIRINEDGDSFVEEFIEINKLEKVSENIWWPVEGTIESDRRKEGDPYTRTVYRAFNVIANESDFDESVFSVSFPPGCLIDDKVENRQYRISEDPNTNQ